MTVEGPMYRTSRLGNRLRIVTCEQPERSSVALGIWITVGGRHEAPEEKGAAHFLEHLLFKGSRGYSCRRIKESVEGVGGNLNAFTAEEQTCYYAKVPARWAAAAFEILADMVARPLLRRGDLERERSVILEEIKMYHDLPQAFVMDRLDEMIWPGHPLGMPVTGTEASVGAMTRAQLKAFHAAAYVPANIVVAVCGRMTHSAVERLVRRGFGDRPSGGPPPPTEPPDRREDGPSVRLFPKSIEQMHLAWGVPGLPEGHADKYALHLLHVLLGGNMSSRLFHEVRERRALAYSISSLVKTLDDTGLFAVRAGVDNNKIVEAVTAVERELERIRRVRIPDGEFRRARDYYLGQFLLGLEDTLDHMFWIGEGVVRGRVETFAQVARKVRRVTPEDIRRVARGLLHPSRYRLAVVGPLNAGQERDLAQIFH